MNTTKAEKIAKKELLDKCWEYFNDNFHKFTEANKIKIGLALCVKDMPAQFESPAGDTKIIIMRDGNKAQELSRQVHLQSETLSGDGVKLGDGEINVRNTAGNDILRADPGQFGNSVQA